MANLDLEMYLSKFEVVMGGFQNHTWTKNAGNFMKWINPLKKFFFSLANLDLEIFLSKFNVVMAGGQKIFCQSLMWWWQGGGGQKSHLNQKCRKFHEMDKSTKKKKKKKKIFPLFGRSGLRNFFVKVLGGGGGGGGSKITPWYHMW